MSPKNHITSDGRSTSQYTTATKDFYNTSKDQDPTHLREVSQLKRWLRGTTYSIGRDVIPEEPFV